MINSTAAAGFTRGADEYDRGRPDYPQALIDRLGLHAGSRVIDLGAGTGKMTRFLVRTGAAVSAVEPLPAMAEKIRENAPEADLYQGTAEAIPLPDASVDLVVVAQAFHWFDGKAALREIARVLRPRGQLALVWNIRDESIPWIRELTALLAPYEGETPRYHTMKWREAFSTPLQHEIFPYVQRTTHAGLRDRMTSISFISALPEAERANFLRKLDQLMATQPEPLELSYRTHLYLTTPGG